MNIAQAMGYYGTLLLIILFMVLLSLLILKTIWKTIASFFSDGEKVNMKVVVCCLGFLIMLLIAFFIGVLIKLIVTL